MSVFKWLSTVTGVGTSVLAAVALWAVASPGWLDNTPAIATLAFTAIIIGAVPGIAIWLTDERYRRQLDRLTGYFEQLADSDTQEQLEELRFGLDELKNGIDGTFTQLRGRVRELVRIRRDLEIRVRVSDAERRHLQVILNAISDPVLVTDAFNEVALANKAACHLFRMALEDIRHQPVDQVVRDPELARLIRDTRASLSAAPTRERRLEHTMNLNGRTTVFNLTFSPVPALADPGNTPSSTTTAIGCAGIVTILRDVTREKEIAEMKSDFVSNVSHELRTPLSSIKAYMEMLVDGEAQDEQARIEFYNVIQGETNRLSRLIDNILNISRIESGVIKIQRENLDLVQLARDAIDIIQPQARACHITIEDHLGNPDCLVAGDHDMLLQSVLNLLSNAIKYTPAQGRVSVSRAHDESAAMARLTVSDTGSGIPDADLPHVFDKFYRVADHKKLAKGTGLGLNLVKHVVETVHGGKVTVTSAVGIGSTFTLSLPIAEK